MNCYSKYVSRFHTGYITNSNTYESTWGATMTSNSPLNRLWEGVKGLIPRSSQKENEEKNEKEELTVKQSEKEEASSKCPHDFGYLTSRRSDAATPEECLTCQNLLECRNSRV